MRGYLVDTNVLVYAYDPTDAPKPESTEGVGRVSVLKRQEGAPLNLG